MKYVKCEALPYSKTGYVIVDILQYAEVEITNHSCTLREITNHSCTLRVEITNHSCTLRVEITNHSCTLRVSNC